MKEIIPKVETILKKIPEEKRTEIRRELQHRISSRLKEKEKNGEDRKTLRNLKKNRDLAILQTDKSGKIVIMDRIEYNVMMNKAIEKLGAIKIDKDPNDKINRKVEKLIKEGSWPDEDKPHSNFGTSVTPPIFGRLKDHKDPMIMRPVVNKKAGPTYKLEVYMKKIYEIMLENSNHSLKSTDEFIKIIRDIKVEDDDKIVSFDVVNLYPSINTEEIKGIVNQKFDQYYKDNTRDTIKSASNLLLSESYFSFSGECFKQKNGLPMGSPISSVLAEVKMRYMDKLITEKYNNIRVWVRYVDDIFVIMKNDSDPDKMLKEINELDSSIKFTLEEAVENTINFLDVKVTKQNNKLITTVFRKPMTTLNFIDAKCATPHYYKLSAIRAHVERAVRICSNEILLEKELIFIQKKATESGYKKNLVNKLYENYIKRIEKIEPAQREKIKFTTAIPYVKGVTEYLVNKCRELGVKVPIKPSRSVFQQIRNEKDVIDCSEKSGIYRIECLDTENKIKCYIGVTKRKIKTRIKEHKRDIKDGKRGTALAQSFYEGKIDEIHFDKVKRLAAYDGHECAYLREAVEIISAEEAINSVEHAQISREWKDMLGRANDRGAREGRKSDDGLRRKGSKREEPD